jgi:hypothetical protein
MQNNIKKYHTVHPTLLQSKNTFYNFLLKESGKFYTSASSTSEKQALRYLQDKNYGVLKNWSQHCDKQKIPYPCQESNSSNSDYSKLL